MLSGCCLVTSIYISTALKNQEARILIIIFATCFKILFKIVILLTQGIMEINILGLITKSANSTSKKELIEIVPMTYGSTSFLDILTIICLDLLLTTLLFFLSFWIRINAGKTEQTIKKLLDLKKFGVMIRKAYKLSRVPGLALMETALSKFKQYSIICTSGVPANLELFLRKSDFFKTS